MRLIFLSYVKERLKYLLLFLLFFLIMTGVFFLYAASLDMVIYAYLLCGTVGLAVLTLSFIRYARKCTQLAYMEKKILYDVEGLPESGNRAEELYRRMVEKLFAENQQMQSLMRIEKKEMEEYYMLWAHQIKTPIAAMNLLLQSGEADERSLSAELFKIEQYVEMVLGYLRAGRMSSDLALNEYALLDIVKQAIRKYSRLFILQKLKLNLEEMDYRVVTDEKWLLFAVEQILSNALKYTKQGSVSVYMDKERAETLVIEDTGIGISAEDLPRVVEKGFTGYNGRDNKKSTGLGLYLSKEILTKLGHTLSIESEVGKGTRIYIGLGRK